MRTEETLARMLADGSRHSGNALAAGLGLSRAAVWKQIRRLREHGLEIHSSSGQGYRLARPLQLLDGRHIAALLDAQTAAACESLEVAWSLGSTSTVLGQRPAPAPGHWRGVLAEYQTEGRGRRQRRWFSPLGSGLCLSMSWLFPHAPRDLAALSLAVGVAMIRALGSFGAQNLSLKWPNDILCGDAKLAGILVDVDGDARGPLRVIIGTGVNVTAPGALQQSVVADGGLQPACLQDAVPGGESDRNAVAAEIIMATCRVLQDFAVEGFHSLGAEWRRHDYLLGRQLRVLQGSGEEICGFGSGIAADGALLVNTGERQVAVFNGDVSVRY